MIRALFRRDVPAADGSLTVVNASRESVLDWAADFDHHDPLYAEHAGEVWAELREHCPVARAEPELINTAVEEFLRTGQRLANHHAGHGTRWLPAAQG